MKKLIVLLLFLFAASDLHAQENGTVYFMRSTGFQGSASAFTAFIDGELACKLNNKKYSIHEVAAGEHQFTVQFGGKKSKKKAEPITINIEAGNWCSPAATS
jgi:hypothetical protein